jgi:hypothetical protein
MLKTIDFGLIGYPFINHFAKCVIDDLLPVSLELHLFHTPT